MANYYNEQTALMLLQKYRTSQDINDRNELLEYLLPIIKGRLKCNSRLNNYIDKEDLFQDCIFPIATAIERYDFNANVKFFTYLNNCLYWVVLKKKSDNYYLNYPLYQLDESIDFLDGDGTEEAENPEDPTFDNYYRNLQLLSYLDPKDDQVFTSILSSIINIWKDKEELIRLSKNTRSTIKNKLKISEEQYISFTEKCNNMIKEYYNG